MKFEESDTRSMPLWEKGKILALYNKELSVPEIAEVCDRSLYWTQNIIGALAGTEIEYELIKEYEAYEDRGMSRRRMQNTGSSEQIRVVAGTGSRVGRRSPGASRVLSSNRRSRNKKDSGPVLWGKRSKGISTISGHSDTGQSADRKTVRKDSNKSSTIVEKLRKNVDYAGD